MTITKAIENNDLELAKSLIREYILRQDEDMFYSKLKREYENTFRKEDENGESYWAEDYISFDEWLNETKVIQEATYDEDGNQLTEEVTELAKPYVKPSNIDELVENYIASRYAELRKIEYPDLGEQLDMLYKDMTNGTNNWLEAIRQIKEKYPKV